ncbi:MAG: hypothetical protein Q8P67_25350 [archaeon]|nr:hypothetical protein [archaeon]
MGSTTVGSTINNNRSKGGDGMTRQVWLRPKKEKEKRKRKREEKEEKEEREKEKQCCDIFVDWFFYQNDNFLFFGRQGRMDYRVGLV